MSTTGATARSDSQTIAFHRSDDDFPEAAFFPAAWPAQPDRVRRVGWCLATAGPGFDGLRLRLEFDVRTNAVLESAIALAQPFANGQLTSFRPAAQHVWEGLERPVAGGSITLDALDFTLPPTEPGTRKQFLIRVQVALRIGARCEATVVPTVEAMDRAFAPIALPPVRVRAVEATWIPVRGTSSPEVALLLAEPAVVSRAAVFTGAGESERASVQRLFDGWLAAMSLPAGAVASVRTQKQRTAKGNVSLNSWNAPAANLRADKRWEQLFRASRDYRSVAIDLVPAHAVYPVAGAMMNASHRERRPSNAEDEEGESLSCALWFVNEPRVYADYGTSTQMQDELFASWVGASAVVQAWIAEAVWFPAFGSAPTLYERAVPRIRYNSTQLTHLAEAPSWSSRRLRFIGRRMWLGERLAHPIDADALERVALVRRHATLLELTARPGVGLGEIEEALAPILPSNDDVTRALERKAHAMEGVRPSTRANALATLAQALYDVAGHEKGTQKLERAIAVLDEALSLFDGPSWPQGFASFQKTRTAALLRLGERRGTIEPLQAAVVGQRRAVQILGDALEGATPGHREVWVDAQVSLGSALAALGEREPGTESFQEAVSLFEFALRECSETDETSLEKLGIADESNALRRAIVQARLGFAQLALATRTQDRPLADAAARLVQEAQTTVRNSVNGKAVASDFEMWSERVRVLLRRLDVASA